MYYELSDRFIVSADAEATWEFFSRADNLPRITPPWLSFRVHTAMPLEMRRGAILDYTIRWMGLPVKWRTRIIDWSPPRQFIDVQLRGPYALWHHQHTFEPAADGTRCEDRVVYRLPGGIVGRVTHRLIVERQLKEIFRFRREVIAENLGWVRAEQKDVEIHPL